MIFREECEDVFTKTCKIVMRQQSYNHTARVCKRPLQKECFEPVWINHLIFKFSKIVAFLIAANLRVRAPASSWEAGWAQCCVSEYIRDKMRGWWDWGDAMWPGGEEDLCWGQLCPCRGGGAGEPFTTQIWETLMSKYKDKCGGSGADFYKET